MFFHAKFWLEENFQFTLFHCAQFIQLVCYSANRSGWLIQAILMLGDIKKNCLYQDKILNVPTAHEFWIYEILTNYKFHADNTKMLKIESI